MNFNPICINGQYFLLNSKKDNLFKLIFNHIKMNILSIKIQNLDSLNDGIIYIFTCYIIFINFNINSSIIKNYNITLTNNERNLLYKLFNNHFSNAD